MMDLLSISLYFPILSYDIQAKEELVDEIRIFKGGR